MNTANYTKCWLDYKELPEEQKRACLYHPVLMAEGKTAATAGKSIVRRWHSCWESRWSFWERPLRKREFIWK